VARADDHEIFGIDRRKAIVSAVVAVGLLAGLVTVVGQVTSFHQMSHALGNGDKPWFVVCLAGEVLAYAGYIAAYREIARVDGGPCLSPWTAIRIVGIGFGAFVAGSSAGTLGVDYWALHRTGERPHVAARRVLALNVVEWAVFGLFAVASAVTVAAGVGGRAPVAMEVAWFVFVPVCVAAALWVSSPARAGRLSSLPHEDVELEHDPRAWPHWLWQKLRAGFADAVGGLVLVRHLLARPLHHASAMGGFALYWAADIVALYAALRAFGEHPGAGPLVLGYATGYLVTALPLPAGGVGGVEAGLAFALSAVGIPLAAALLATLVYRFFTLWLPIAPALALLPQAKALERELPRVAHAG
jgi:uncharacterized membrane protein YbhN (UPF0104 family)